MRRDDYFGPPLSSWRLTVVGARGAGRDVTEQKLLPRNLVHRGALNRSRPESQKWPWGESKREHRTGRLRAASARPHSDEIVGSCFPQRLAFSECSARSSATKHEREAQLDSHV